MLKSPDRSSVLDFPVFPSPWHIEGGKLRSVSGSPVKAPGVNLAAGACFPSSKTQATSWATKLFKMGVRVVRLHHLDIPVQDWGWDLNRLQWLLSALKRKGIPVLMEACSQKPWNDDYVRRLLSLEVSNVVMFALSNEDPLSDGEYARRLAVVLGCGYMGIVFGSNSMKQGGYAGQVQDLHLYLDHPQGNKFWDTKYSEQPWNHPNPSMDSPFVCTELGVLYPSPNRGNEERAMVDDLIAKGCQVVCMFALCANETHYLASSVSLDQFSFHSDPERMDTFQHLVCRMNGRVYLPRTFDPDFKANQLDTWVWETA